ncbi:8208_t:CDS:1, partial [Scutellospora calospora]
MTPEIFNSNEHSFYDKLLTMSPPIELFMTVDELTSPAYNSRRAKQYRKNPSSITPPRPPNGFVLYRKNCYAEIKLTGTKTKNENVSSLASQRWKENPQIHYYFEIAAEAAKERHNLLYPGYKYSPKRKDTNQKKKSKRVHKSKIGSSCSNDFILNEETSPVDPHSTEFQYNNFDNSFFNDKSNEQEFLELFEEIINIDINS